mmetsp:Transcript_14435/g.30871  ORF Transcript_14435/g.30871 Transcript_14435/m.30871 type:complete len:298 (-) Transcript_14435:103-996(-)
MISQLLRSPWPNEFHKCNRPRIGPPPPKPLAVSILNEILQQRLVLQDHIPPFPQYSVRHPQHHPPLYLASATRTHRTEVRHVDHPLHHVLIPTGHPTDRDAASSPRLAHGDRRYAPFVRIRHRRDSHGVVVFQQPIDLVAQNDDAALSTNAYDLILQRGVHHDAAGIVRLVQYQKFRIRSNRPPQLVRIHLPIVLGPSSKFRDSRIAHGPLGGFHRRLISRREDYRMDAPRGECQRGRLHGGLAAGRYEDVLGGEFVVVDDAGDVATEVEGAADGDVFEIVIVVEVEQFRTAVGAGF